jgi:hypothetical protein
MLAYEDIHFQLVDLPPVSSTYMESWMPNALQPARGALLVVDLASPACVENVEALMNRLDEKRISLGARWPGEIDPRDLDAAAGRETLSPVTGTPEETFEADDPFRTHIPTLLVANKIDLRWDPEEIAVLEDLAGIRFPALAVSAETGAGLDKLARVLFRGLGIVRVYTKAPGRAPEKDKPFTCLKGDTVVDVARLVHRDLAESLKFARVWGSAKYDGQRVARDHVLCDGDVVELHE